MGLPFISQVLGLILAATPADILPARLSPGAMGLLADFDGDGNIDRLSADPYESSITFHRGDGQGGFTPINTLPILPGPYLETVIDVDGDGASEAVVMTCCAPTTHWLVRVAPAGIASATPIAQPAGVPWLVRAGDFTGDGLPDLLGVDLVSYGLLAGNGSGGFAPSVNSQKNADVTYLSMVADVDADGDLDALAAGSPGCFAVAVNTGAGQFLDVMIPTNVPGYPEPIATGDFDGDGLTDLVVGSQSVSFESFAYLRGTGSSTTGPTFIEHATIQSTSLVPGSSTVWLTSAGTFDADHDGRPELALMSSSDVGCDLTLLKHAATPAGFGVLAHWSFVDVPTQVGAVLDLDGDGAVDFIGDRGNVRSLVVHDVMTPDPDLAFIDIGPGQHAVVVAVDVDLDGDSDVVTTDAQGLTVEWRANSGGVLGPAVALLTVPAFVARIVATDYDFDGDADLVVRTQADVHLLRNSGGGTFAALPPVAMTITPPFGFLSDRCVTGDVDRDGFVDVVVVSNAGITVTILYGAPAGLVLGPAVVSPFPLVRDVALADLTGDGWLDIVLLSERPFPQAGAVIVLAGGASSTFPNVMSGFAAQNARALATGDFDQDGHVDVAFTAPQTDTIEILRGTGAALVSHVSLPYEQIPSEMTGLRAVDFTQDGWLDLMARGNGTEQALAVFAGRHDGSFSPLGAYACFGLDSAVCDFDGDGRLDVLSVGYGADLLVSRAQDGALGIVVYGAGKPGTHGEPTLGVLGAPVLGAPFGLRLDHGLAGAVPVLFLGAQRAALSFDSGTLNVLPLVTIMLPPFPALGRIDLPATLANAPAFVGLTLDLQAMFADPGAAGFLQTAQTKGLEIRFGT